MGGVGCLVFENVKDTCRVACDGRHGTARAVDGAAPSLRESAVNGVGSVLCASHRVRMVRVSDGQHAVRARSAKSTENSFSTYSNMIPINCDVRDAALCIIHGVASVASVASVALAVVAHLALLAGHQSKLACRRRRRSRRWARSSPSTRVPAA